MRSLAAGRADAVRRLALALLAAAAWAAAWALPWQAAVAAPALRVALAWLGLALPGVCWAALLLRGESDDRAVHALALGPALSLALVGVVGAAGGPLGASPRWLAAALFASGASGLAGLAACRVAPGAGRDRRATALALAVVAAAAALAACWARLPAVGSDNYSYLAQIAAGLQRDRLPFELELVPGRPLAPARFWLAAWPLAQAWLSGAAQVDALALSTLYIDPLLAAWSVLAVYALGRALRLPPLLASAAAVAQVVSCAVLVARDQPGFVLFTRLNEDKALAAFVLAPLLCATAAALLERPSRRRALLCGLAGLAVVCTHPPMFGMAAAIVLLSAGLDALARRRAAGLLTLAALFAALAVLPFSFRFGRAPMWEAVPFTAADLARQGGPGALLSSRLTEYAGGYAVALHLVAGVPFAVVLAAALVGLTRLRRQPAARLVVAAAAVVGAALFPPTAALLALAITYIQIWRLPWLLPFGIAAALLIAAPAPRGGRAATAWAAAQLALLGIAAWAAPAAVRAERESTRYAAAGGAPVLHLQLAGHGVAGPLRPSTCRRAFADLAAIGGALERRIDGTAVVLGDRETNDILPALSRRVRIAVFRNPAHLASNSGLPQAEVDARMRAWAALMAPATDPAARRAALRDLQVEYLLVCGAPAWSTALRRETNAPLRPIVEAGNLTLFQVAL